MIRLALVLLLLTAGTWHGPVCDTLGVRLKAWSVVEAPDIDIPPGYGIAYQMVKNNPQLEWVSFGLFADTTLRWPKRVPMLYRDSTRLVPKLLYAIEGPPRLAPVPLFLGSTIDPDRMWRLRFHGKGEVATVIFAGYPRDAGDIRKADRLRLEPAPAP